MKKLIAKGLENPSILSLSVQCGVLAQITKKRKFFLLLLFQ